ncbi:hypothetical protein [Thiothrix unzii]|uniref:Uncharacterized protein n=1 Tax=Thiothrix unzii TaxID=111769 RepID=A0A975F9D9_9GAMM|nr:hypothetical protein [Thiothrix unzii]QTR53687.1 hypothetical protein J9260_00935 [Thiothrix unzii]
MAEAEEAETRAEEVVAVNTCHLDMYNAVVYDYHRLLQMDLPDHEP